MLTVKKRNAKKQRAYFSGWARRALALFAVIVAVAAITALGASMTILDDEYCQYIGLAPQISEYECCNPSAEGTGYEGGFNYYGIMGFGGESGIGGYVGEAPMYMNEEVGDMVGLGGIAGEAPGYIPIMPFNIYEIEHCCDFAAAVASSISSGFPVTAQLMNDICVIAGTRNPNITLTVLNDANVTLIGTHTIRGDANSSVAAGVAVANGGTLTMGTIVGGPTVTGALNSGVRVGGTFNLLGGYIDGNSALRGGGVCVLATGTFYMHGGVIQNNIATSTGQSSAGGAGVMVHGGTGPGALAGSFTMSGGIIRNNIHVPPNPAAMGHTLCVHWRSGNGGVMVGMHGEHNASFLMYAADEYNPPMIYNNRTTGQGGGVTVHYRHTFTMYGGIIRNNHARINGGGVAVWGIFTMNGGTIKYNNAGVFDPVAFNALCPDGQRDYRWIPRGPLDINGTGGGVFIGMGRGRFFMEDGLIHGNQALNGGAVGMSAHNDAPVFEMRGGVLSYNRAVEIEGFETYGPIGEEDMHRTGNGGALYQRGGSQVLIGVCPSIPPNPDDPRLPAVNPVWIQGNHAERYGGAFYSGAIFYTRMFDGMTCGLPFFLCPNPCPGTPENPCPSVVGGHNCGNCYCFARYGHIRILNAEIFYNEACNGGAIYTALRNIYPNPARHFYVHHYTLMRGNLARNGPLVNDRIAFINRYVVRPSEFTHHTHPFTNHDIFVPALHGVSISKTAVSPEYPIFIGDRVRYRITVVNYCPVAGTETEPIWYVHVRDFLPTALEFVPGSQHFSHPNGFAITGWPGPFAPSFTHHTATNKIELMIYAMPGQGVFYLEFEVYANKVGRIPNTSHVEFYFNYAEECPITGIWYFTVMQASDRDTHEILVYPRVNLNFTKTDNALDPSEGDPLPGAVFHLYRRVWFVDPCDVDPDPDWYEWEPVKDFDDDPSVNDYVRRVLTTGANGQIITDLPLWPLDRNRQDTQGNYYPQFKLVEYSAPDSFVTPPGHWLVRVDVVDVHVFTLTYSVTITRVLCPTNDNAANPTTPVFDWCDEGEQRVYRWVSRRVYRQVFVEGEYCHSVYSHTEFYRYEFYEYVYVNQDFYLGNWRLLFPLHKASHLMFDMVATGTPASWDWPAINQTLLQGAVFNMYRWDAGTPPVAPGPGYMIGPGTTTPPPTGWEPIASIGGNISTGNVNTPIVFPLHEDFRYFQLVEALAPPGWETPFGQWRFTLANSPTIPGAGWEPIVPGWWLLQEIIGCGSTPRFVRQPPGNYDAEGYLVPGSGEWYVANRTAFELPLTGGRGMARGNFFVLLAGVIVILLAGGVAAKRYVRV